VVAELGAGLWSVTDIVALMEAAGATEKRSLDSPANPWRQLMAGHRPARQPHAALAPVRVG
jgi:hypothetical protein